MKAIKRLDRYNDRIEFEQEKTEPHTSMQGWSKARVFVVAYRKDRALHGRQDLEVNPRLGDLRGESFSTLADAR